MNDREDRTYVEHDSEGTPFIRVLIRHALRRTEDGFEIVTRLLDPDDPDYMIREWRDRVVNGDTIDYTREDIVPLARTESDDAQLHNGGGS